MKIKFDDFDCVPSRYDENEAWVYHRNKNAGVEINRISHGNAVYEVSKEDFNYLHPNLPPLPPTAFRSSE